MNESKRKLFEDILADKTQNLLAPKKSKFNTLQSIPEMKAAPSQTVDSDQTQLITTSEKVTNDEAVLTTSAKKRKKRKAKEVVEENEQQDKEQLSDASIMEKSLNTLGFGNESNIKNKNKKPK